METEDQRKVMGMKCPTYHDLDRASFNLASIAEEIADLNFNINTGKLNKHTKSCHPAWGPKDFFSGVGYHTHNLEGYNVRPKLESLVILSRPPPQSKQWRTSGGPGSFSIHA